MPASIWADAEWIGTAGVAFGCLTLLTTLLRYQDRRLLEGRPRWLPRKRTLLFLCVGGVVAFAVAASMGSLETSWSDPVAGILADVSLVLLLVALSGCAAQRKRRKAEAAGGSDSAWIQPRPITCRRQVLLAARLVFFIVVMSFFPSAICGLYLASLLMAETPQALPPAPGYLELVDATKLCEDRSPINVWQTSHDVARTLRKEECACCCDSPAGFEPAIVCLPRLHTGRSRSKTAPVPQPSTGDDGRSRASRYEWKARRSRGQGA